MLVNLTDATLFRLCDRYHPTLFFDEADAVSKERLESLRGTMNSGHKKSGAMVPRMHKGEIRLFSLWAPKATARIGTDLHPTQLSRSIQIEMRQRVPEERMANAKLPRNPHNALENVRRRCIRWGADNVGKLREATPTLPPELGDRQQDNFEGMLAIADLCARGEEARKAALVLCAVKEDMGALSALLLSDLHDLFAGTEEMPSATVISKLTELKDRPWRALHQGQPISEKGMAKLLKPYRIASRKLSSGERPQGYRARQFREAWEHALYTLEKLKPMSRMSRQNERSAEVNEDRGAGDSGSRDSAACPAGPHRAMPCPATSKMAMGRQVLQ